MPQLFVRLPVFGARHAHEHDQRLAARVTTSSFSARSGCDRCRSVDFSDNLVDGRERTGIAEVNLELVVDTLLVPILPRTAFVRAGGGDLSDTRKARVAFALYSAPLWGWKITGRPCARSALPRAGVAQEFLDLPALCPIRISASSSLLVATMNQKPSLRKTLQFVSQALTAKGGPPILERPCASSEHGDSW